MYSRIFSVGILSICLFVIVPAIPAYSAAKPIVSQQDFVDIGLDYLHKRDYSNAIDYLKRALKGNPKETSIRNNLAVAYNSRGTYYYNNNIDLEKAANDYRSAIYYLKYFGNYPNSTTINENIKLAEQNLNNVLGVQKFDLSAQNRLKKAKELRGKGELEASVLEYLNAAKDKNLAYESYYALGDVTNALDNKYSAGLYYDKALAIKSDDAHLHLKYGKILYQLGNIDNAIKELNIASQNDSCKEDSFDILENIWQKKISENPKDAAAQMNLGAIYQEKGFLDKAMSQYKLAQSLDPKNQMVKLNMATLYEKQGNYSEAIKIYDGFLALYPNDTLINTYKAGALYKTKNYVGAIAIYKKLLLQNPNNNELKNSLITSIKELPEESAKVYIQELVSLYPNDENMLYEIAYYYHSKNKFQEALSFYNKVLALNNTKTDAYLNIAAIYKSQNNYQKALNVLNSSKEYIKNNNQINVMIKDLEAELSFNIIQKATNLYDEKKYNEAINVYNSIQSPSEDVFLGLGACYQALEDYDKAISYYNKALQLDATNPNTYYFLGLAYYYKKDFKNAEIYLKKAMNLDNLNPEIKEAFDTLKYAQSEDEMNKAVELFDKNQYNEALILLNSSLNHYNKNGYAYYYRGMTYDVLNKYNNAISDYKNAIKYEPDLLTAYYSMAMCYENLNNMQEAKNMYKKFVEIYKNQDEYLEYAKKRLSELK